MTQPVQSEDIVSFWGVLGIIFSICFWPLGLVFDFLGLREAKLAGKRPTSAYLGFGLAAVFAVLTILSIATGGRFAM